MQAEYIGRNSACSIVEALKRLSAKSVLLVTGKASYRTSGAEAIFSELLSPFQVTHFSDFSPNPTLEEALKGVEICREVKANVVIAVGGGSAMDVAKAIAAFRDIPGQERELVTGKISFPADVVPIIAVPTTSGTGSEATHFSVIYLEGKKYSLSDQCILPTIVILDANFTESLSPYITASTGFDAFCQSVESFWSRGANPNSRAFAKKAIEIIVKYLPKAVNDGDSRSREKMLEAANYGGKAINISKTTAPHALSYMITSLFGVAHGHAAALTLGSFFPYHLKQMGVELNEGLSWSEMEKCQQELYSMLGAEDAVQAKEGWYELMKRCGLDTQVAGTALAESPQIEKIVAGVNLERLNNHPVKLSAANLQQIIQSVPDLKVSL